MEIFVFFVTLVSFVCVVPFARLAAQRPHIVLVGDSTVTDDSGWGIGFKQLVGPGAAVTNTAANGRSSKSFIDEGKWASALALKGDYYLIQFGHNDEPGKGPERETDPRTTYTANMRRYVSDVRAMGKTPILVTSLVRRMFDASGKIKSTQTPYVEAVRALAREDRVALVDLFASSSALVERQGGAAFVDLSPKTADGAVDTTHLNARGSLVFARLVVDGLRTAVPALAPVLLRDPARVAWDDVPKQPAAWFGSDEAARIADLALLYQRDTGGWPKNIDMSAPLSSDARTRLLAERVNTDSTIDNGATVTQLRALARVHTARPDDRYRDAFARGLRYLLRAQYANGGWPQYFPLRADYSKEITFNDDAMINVMTLLDDLSGGAAPFAFVEAATRAEAAAAVERGRRLILQAQIRVNGTLTGWCQQHDARSLAPVKGRAYEHPSIASKETAGIVRFLMRTEKPDAATRAAIDGAIAWLRASALHGIRLERRPDATGPGGFDVIVVPDAGAPDLWARFYAIETNQPMFSGRDGVIRPRLADIEIERRTGYSWIGDYAGSLLAREYPAWQKRAE